MFVRNYIRFASLADLPVPSIDQFMIVDGAECELPTKIAKF
jgi:hypothetical protein